MSSHKHQTMSYKPVIGAEIHVELATKSKMFCGCRNDPFGAGSPNIYTCPVCLGLPGALPVPSRQAIENCLKIGLALNCTVAHVSKFDRKHYFYPDLPKGYQISQYDEPFCEGGYVDTSEGRVGITRVHMEEDTAKLTHTVLDGKKVSLIDFNRSGVPLVEIVTEPDIKSPAQAKEVLKQIRDIVRALGVSDCDMEKGSMRLELNISLKEVGASRDSSDDLPPYKVEVKNINSFRFFEKAAEYEIKRHTELLNQGKTPVQETRGYRSDKGITVSQRTKEEAADYRYFPEPDIPPFVFSAELVEDLRASLPELPGATTNRLIELGVKESDAELISRNAKACDFIFAVANESPDLVSMTASNLVNKKFAFTETTPQDYLKKLKDKSDTKISDLAVLTPIVEKVLEDNPVIVSQYQSGKTGVLGFFMGAVMKETRGQADPKIATSLLQDMLK